MTQRSGSNHASHLVGSGVDRRRMLTGLAAALSMLGCNHIGCSRKPGAARSSRVDTRLLRVRHVRFPASPVGPQQAVILEPRWSSDRPQGFPLLVALHGRGEAHRGVEAGAWGWVHDYHLDRALLRLRRPPLTERDLAGVATQSYLQKLNETIASKPFRGLIVVCPFTPDIMTSGKLEAARPFAEFVKGQLLPKVKQLVGERVDMSAIGIDGVSLGGRESLLTGAYLPTRFRAVGSLQAAFRPEEVPAVARLLSKQWPATRRPEHVRLLTSERDPFRPTLRRLHESLNRAGIVNEFVEVPGPHDYVFNQGPGSYEMLVWHDRVLRS